MDSRLVVALVARLGFMALLLVSVVVGFLQWQVELQNRAVHDCRWLKTPIIAAGFVESVWPEATPRWRV